MNDLKVCINCNRNYEYSEGKLEGYCDFCIEVCKECGEQIPITVSEKTKGYCVDCNSKVTRTCYYCQYYSSGKPILTEECYYLNDKIYDIENHIKNVGHQGDCSFWTKR